MWHVTPEIRTEIINQLNNGISIKQACRNLNIINHYNTVRADLKRNNIQSSYSKKVKQKIKDKYLEEIVKLYTQDKKNLAELSKQYNVSSNTIGKWLTEQGIELRPMYISRKKLHLNTEYFDNINSCSKAYVLGFMAADGYVTDKNGIGMGLKALDADVLYFLKEQWEAENKVKIQHREQGDRAVLQVESKHMAESLKRIGIIPRKTYKLNPSNILAQAGISKGDDLEKAFLLGYFDGDGGITHYVPSEETKRTKHYCEMFSLNVTGTLETCQYYQDFVDGIGKLRQRHPDRPVNNWTLVIGGRNQCKKLLTPLYSVKDQIGFCLNHKYELFKML